MLQNDTCVRQGRVKPQAEKLFDARYAASSYSRLWIYPGAPRTVRASLRLEI